MKCREARKLVYKDIDGELDSRLEDQFRQHLQVCGSCGREYQEVSDDHRLLSGSVAALPVSPDFVPGVMARIRAVETWKSGDSYHLVLSRRAVRWAVVGALIVLMGVIASLRSLKFREPVRQVAAPQAPSVLPPVPVAPAKEYAAVPSPPPVEPVKQVAPLPSVPRQPTVPSRPPAPLAAKIVSSAQALMVRAEVPSAWKPMRSNRSVHLGEIVRTSGSLAKVTTLRGDRLWLNRSTVVQFRGREVALFRGEVFVVAKHSAHGLIVRTPGTTTTVHGTRFNVRLLGDAVQVTVVEGKVAVGTSAGATFLRASQQVTASPGAPPSEPQIVDVRPVVAWTGLPDMKQPTASPEPLDDLTGVTFAVSPEAATFAGADNLPTFELTMDYATIAPSTLRLRLKITGANGKVVLEREESLADEQSRYRVKKVVLDKLPLGEYDAEFKLVAGKAEISRKVRFWVH